MSLGWIKLHRRLLDHPRFTDEGWLRVWVALLLLANHSKDGQRRIFKGGEIVLKPGQLLTSRDSLARTAGLHPSSVERVLAKLKTEQQIEQQADNKSRLITILSWAEYQDTEQQIEQPANNSRTASEQPANTHKNVKKEKNDENGEKGERGAIAPARPRNSFVSPSIEECISYAKTIDLSEYEAIKFRDRNIAVGWKVGSNPMKDWKGAMRTWKSRVPEFAKQTGAFPGTLAQPPTPNHENGFFGAN